MVFYQVFRLRDCRETRNNRVPALVSEDRDAILNATKDLIPEGRELLFEETLIAGGKKTRYTAHVVLAATELSGEDVLDAMVTYDPNSLTKDQRFLLTSQVFGKRFGDIMAKTSVIEWRSS